MQLEKNDSRNIQRIQIQRWRKRIKNLISIYIIKTKRTCQLKEEEEEEE